jgi:hypothetical protein
MIPVLAGDVTFVCGSFFFLIGELVWNLDYFYLDKGLFIEKMAQICNFSKEKMVHSEISDKFQSVVKNIILFLLSM